MDASEQNGGAASPDLAPDVATSQGSIDRSDAVALVGYVGEGCSGEYRRLYESVALNRWIEILAVDIVDRVAVPGTDDPTVGQSWIWVRRDAQLALCESVRASSFDGAPGPEETLKWPRP
jgi:hypothetical protein